MPNLYEILGVDHRASQGEIESRYKVLSQFFDPEQTAGFPLHKEEEPGRSIREDPTLKLYFDDLSLAYKTLSNADSRAEYDDYISQIHRISRFWDEENHKNREEEDPEAAAEKQRRRRERGKRRFEEDFSFANDEFFASWQNRTSAGKG